MTINTPNNSNGFQDWVILAPEVREGFSVTEEWEFELPLAQWEFPDHFVMYSFNMYFPKESLLDENIPDSIVIKLWDGSQALSMHVLWYPESWGQADDFLHNARENSIKKIKVKFERRSYAGVWGEVRDMGYYLRGLSPVDATIALPDSLVNNTSASVWWVINTSLD
jgi:hypothetical protein